MEGSEHLRPTREQVAGSELSPVLPPAPEHEQPRPELTDEERRAIELAIEAARAEDREVDDYTAWRIALHLHGGEDSALHGFVSTGSLEDERLGDELHAPYQDHNPQVREWAGVLGTYALHREERGPVEGWSGTTDEAAGAGQPGRQESPGGQQEEQARRELLGRINAAAVTTLGQVATVVTQQGEHGLGAAESDDHPEPDLYPWIDAVRWRPDEPDSETAEELFTRLPDTQLGSVEEMGWCGLLKHEGRPGGVGATPEPVRAPVGLGSRYERRAGGEVAPAPGRARGVPVRNTVPGG